LRRFRIAIIGESPCDQCHGANCCRQNGHDYAVLLEEAEYGRFGPFAADVLIEHAGVRQVEKVLPYVQGRCQFLGEDNRCTIYDDRPQNCRRFQCVDYYHNRGTTPAEHGRFLLLNPDVLSLLERQ
jgi:Fe-S-cluster containining protein